MCFCSAADDFVSVLTFVDPASKVSMHEYNLMYIRATSTPDVNLDPEACSNSPCFVGELAKGETSRFRLISSFLGPTSLLRVGWMR